jgi:fatty acid synthase subunit alpha
MDKEGRSIPAPGQGILTTAREAATVFESPMLDLDYRKENLEEELGVIAVWAKAQRKAVVAEAKALVGTKGESEGAAAAAYVAERAANVDRLEAKKRAGAFDTWGQNFFRGNPTISPLRGALSVWGLNVCDNILSLSLRSLFALSSSLSLLSLLPYPLTTHTHIFFGVLSLSTRFFFHLPS